MLTVNSTTPPDEAAVELIQKLDAFGVDYAIGGALAIGVWGEPRATKDVDITLFLDPTSLNQTIQLLQAIECRFEDNDKNAALATLREFGFCRVAFRDCAIDVFLPTLELLSVSKHRRTTALLRGREVRFWNAEIVAVLKMMFNREQDWLDLKKVVRAQGAKLDRPWVRLRLAEIFGERDPRVSTWDEICVAADSPTEMRDVV